MTTAAVDTGFSTESGSKRAERVRLFAQPIAVLVIVAVTLVAVFSSGLNATEKETLNGLTHSLLSLMNILQSADVAPPDHLAAAAADRMRALDEVLGRWREFRGTVPAP